jgi:hypothetical protein
MDTSTLEFLDYLCPKLEDFVTHNFTTKWQDKVELSYLILPSMPFLEVLCKSFVCVLLYVCHLSYKFNLFYRRAFCMFGLFLAFTKALKIHNHYYFWTIYMFFVSKIFYILCTCIEGPFSNHGHVLITFLV